MYLYNLFRKTPVYLWSLFHTYKYKRGKADSNIFYMDFCGLQDSRLFVPFSEVGKEV